MKLSVISFTKAGLLLSKRVEKELDGEPEVRLYTKCKSCRSDGRNRSAAAVETSVREWAGRQMKERNAMLFIGACGIAVRAIAPFLTDKLRDAPVLVMDEQGKYVITVLSGHMGGANELAYLLAEKTGAKPVITTATDLNQKFAVDVFARENGLSIGDRDGIVKVSAKVLAGEEITVSIETGHGCSVSEKSGVCVVAYPPSGFADVVITSAENEFDAALVLRPKESVVGFGCKKGKTEEEIRQFIAKKLNENRILTTQIYALASVLQKRDEEGIREWCRKENIPFLTYTAEQLREIKGDFTASAFVKEQVGVDNVCERAALKACGKKGTLMIQKCAEAGMTIAIARRDWKVVRI